MPRAKNRSSTLVAGMEAEGSVNITHMHIEMRMHVYTCMYTHACTCITWNKSEHYGVNEVAKTHLRGLV